MRITIPKKYREKLSKNLVITRGIDWCLFVYDKKIWKQVKNELEEIVNKTTSKDAIDFIRLFMRGAAKVKTGSNDRIIIPEFLSDYAYLKKDIIFIELGKRIEIWAKEKFEKYQLEQPENKGARERWVLRNESIGDQAL